MAGRNANISVKIEGESDFGAARREAKAAIDDIEKSADDIRLTPELDTSEIRKAIDLAKTLDGLTAEMTIDTDVSEIVEAEKLARSLRGFQARVDLSVAGKEELTEALNLSEQMDRLRTVRLEVQGRQDLERAAEIADDLERRRTVNIDVDDSELVSAGDKLEASLDDAGAAGADSIAGHLGDIDFEDIGASGVDQLTGALSAAGPWGAAAATIGVLLADDLAEAFSDHFGSKKATVLRGLRTGLNPEELEAVGRTAGEVYSSGLAEELTRGEIADAAATIKAELGEVDDALDLTSVTRQALALQEVFGTDLTASIAAVDKLVTLGLIPNAEAGFNALFALGQQVGEIRFDEALDVATEFSAALASLGIEGPQGLYLIGEAIDKGIFPQVDQAGEVFEEFNEIIRTGGAADALGQISLSAEDMQDMLARGDGADAMALIAKRLLALPDPAQRAAAAAEIYGGNMALVADPDNALELLAQADGWHAVGDGATDAADKTEAARSNLDAFQKGFGAGLGPLLDGLDSTVGGIANVVGSLTGLGDESDRAVAGADALSTAAREGVGPMGDLADGSGELADQLGAAAQSADELEAELHGLFNFSADQLMSDIAAAADDLAASFEDGAGKAVGLGGAIDISTDSGRRLQDQMEGLTDQLIDAQVAQANNEITAEQLADTQSFLASEFDRVTGAAGLTAGQVEGLRQKYLSVPSEVTTNLRAIDNATKVVQNLQAALSGLKDKTITVTTRNAVIAATAATAKARARGGWTDGLTLVGEEGPELVDFKGRAFVYTAGQTQEIRANRGDLGGPALAGVGGPRINIERLVVDKSVNLWDALDQAELVYGGR